MSGSVNKVILVGTCGRDPEVRTLPNGGKVVSFSVACTESWRDKSSGERKEKTEWVNIAIFNEGLGKVSEQYLRKGSKVYLEGTLQTRKYTDKDGNERQATEVVLKQYRGELVLLSKPSDGGERSDQQGYSQRGGSAVASGGSASRIAADLDDIPFAPEWR